MVFHLCSKVMVLKLLSPCVRVDKLLTGHCMGHDFILMQCMHHTFLCSHTYVLQSIQYVPGAFQTTLSGATYHSAATHLECTKKFGDGLYSSLVLLVMLLLVMLVTLVSVAVCVFVLLVVLLVPTLVLVLMLPNMDGSNRGCTSSHFRWFSNLVYSSRTCTFDRRGVFFLSNDSNTLMSDCFKSWAISLVILPSELEILFINI